MIDFILPESVLWINLVSSSILPVLGKPAGGLPIDYTSDLVASGQYVQTTEIAMRKLKVATVLLVSLSTL